MIINLVVFYFFKELLEFKKSKIINVTKQRAILLLIGVFIFRALITTVCLFGIILIIFFFFFFKLLMKPIKYRLMLGQLTNPQTASLKVLATIMFYVGRRAAKTIPQILVCNNNNNIKKKEQQKQQQINIYSLIEIAA